MVKICAVASCYGLFVIPHGHSVHANVQLSAALPIPYVPLVEYLIKWQTLLQFFWKEPLRPVNGSVTVPSTPGMGMEVDPAKIESERELRWD
jgi:L-alanine-DL-glutamate epimerase-like enolase superfamily enzyme